MAIEFVDPEAIGKEPVSKPEPAPKPESEVTAKNESRGSPKRLVDIDERLGRALSDLESQIEGLHDLNTRLFGTTKAPTEHLKNKTSSQNKGLIAAIDDKMAEFDTLVKKLSDEVKSVDSLA